MLVSIAIEPCCFGPEAIVDSDTRYAAERILHAVTLDNAVIVCGSSFEFLEQFISFTDNLDTKLKPRFQKILAELAKDKKLHFVPLGGLSEKTESARLNILAKELRPDIVVCSNERELSELLSLGVQNIEVCSLANYLDSNTEKKRVSWTKDQALHRMGGSDAKDLLGNTLKYSREILILDPIVGKLGGGKKIGIPLDEFGKAICYLVDQWHSSSPYSSSGKANVRIITLGPFSGARSGSFEIADATRFIKMAVTRNDKNNHVREADIRIEYVEDSRPALFKDRFIKAGRRCWGVQHEIRDIGTLHLPHERRSHTHLIPDCPSIRLHVREIVALNRVS